MNGDRRHGRKFCREGEKCFVVGVSVEETIGDARVVEDDGDWEEEGWRVTWKGAREAKVFL